MCSIRQFDNPQTYRIDVIGHLDENWSDWFDGFSIVKETESQTRLIGQVADQAALHGLLTRIRDLGLPILTVQVEDTRVQDISPKST
jgi:hypothetical protein